MIIERFFWQTKNFDEVVALCKNAIERTQQNGRVFKPVFGEYSQVVLELRFDSRDEAAKFWKYWFDSGLHTELAPQLDAMVTSKAYHETWEVHEPVALEHKGKYVDWRSFVVHPGRVEQATKLLAKTRQSWNRFEIVSPLDGPLNTLALILRFDSMDAYLQEWEDWIRDISTPDFWQEWHSITDYGGETVPYQAL